MQISLSYKNFSAFVFADQSACEFGLVWFGLVSLFNGISTFVGYLIPGHSPRRTVVVQFNP